MRLTGVAGTLVLLLAAAPAGAQSAQAGEAASVDARVAQLERRVAVLERLVALLRAGAGQNPELLYGVVAVGMTPTEVTALLGPPLPISGTFHWYYPASRPGGYRWFMVEFSRGVVEQAVYVR